MKHSDAVIQSSVNCTGVKVEHRTKLLDSAEFLHRFSHHKVFKWLRKGDVLPNWIADGFVESSCKIDNFVYKKILQGCHSSIVLNGTAYVQHWIFDNRPELEYTVDMVTSTIKRLSVFIIYLFVLSLGLLGVDYDQTIKISGWKGLLPVVGTVGQTSDPANDASVAFAYRSLQSAYDLEWFEAFVDPLVQKQFALSYGRFFAEELPFSQLAVSVPHSTGSTVSLKIDGIGKTLKRILFDLVLQIDERSEYHIVAIGNVALSGPARQQ